MISFSNAVGAQYDSAKGQSTEPSKRVQMDVKIPVQPSNFDALQKGALLGALLFIEHNKIHMHQYTYKSKFIPSPGTIFRRTRLWRVFRFLGYGLSIELRSIMRSEDLTLRASAQALFNTAPAPGWPIPSPKNRV
ncbi:TPA: hypothetical protein ACKQIG_004286 [Serratia marcescens]